MLQRNSANSAATLAHEKVFLGARNLTTDPTNKFYDFEALFDKLLTAYMYKHKCVFNWK